ETLSPSGRIFSPLFGRIRNPLVPTCGKRGTRYCFGAKRIFEPINVHLPTRREHVGCRRCGTTDTRFRTPSRASAGLATTLGVGGRYGVGLRSRRVRLACI